MEELERYKISIEALLKDANYQQCLVEVEKGIEKYPGDLYFQCVLAFISLLIKSDEKYALTVIKKIHQTNPDITDRNILWYLVIIYDYCSQPVKVVSTCEKLLRLYPDAKQNPGYYIFMADALNEIEQREKAEEMVEIGRGLTEDKVLVECFRYISARIELGRNNLAKARSIISQFEAVPLESSYTRMVYYLRRGKIRKVKSLLKNIVKHRGKFLVTFNAPQIIQSSYRTRAISMAYNNFGVISLCRSEYGRAIGYFEKALQIRPSDPLIHWLLCSIYSQFGIRDKGRHHLQKAIDGYKQAGTNLWSMYLEVMKIAYDYSEAGLYQDMEIILHAQQTGEDKINEEGLLKDTSFYKLLIEFEKLYKIILKDFGNITKWIFLVSPGLSYAYRRDYLYWIKSQAMVELFRVFYMAMRFVNIIDQGLPRKIPLVENMRIIWSELYKKVRSFLKNEIHRADLDVMYCDGTFERMGPSIWTDVKTKDKILSLYDEAIAAYKRHKNHKKYLMARYKKCWVKEKLGILDLGMSLITNKDPKPNNEIIDEYKNIAAQVATEKDLFELKRDCLFRAGSIYLDRENPKEARECFIESINIIELMRKRLKNVNQIRSAWFASNIDIYAKCIEADYLLQNFNELLFLIESSQNRDLLDNIMNKSVAFQLVSQQSVDFEERWFLSLVRSIATLFKRKIEARSDPFSKMGREFWANLENLKNPHKLIMETAQAKDISSRKVAIIEYFYHKADLYAYLIKPDKGQVKVFYEVEYIDELTKSLLRHNYEIYDDVENNKRRQQKTWIDRSDEGKELMKKLSDMLLPDKIRNEIASYDTLIIVPFGSLHCIPFHCLIDETGKYLFETKTVLQNPSLISFLKCTSTPRAKGKETSSMNVFCGIGMEKYKNRIEKIKDLRGGINIYPSFDTEALDFRQNRKDFLKHHDQCQNLLLISHFVISPRNPFDSSFYLGGEYANEQAVAEDKLTLEDIMRKCSFRNSQFLILAGCNTKIARLQFNELIGAATVFMWKGMPAILSSMWPVNPEVNKYFDEIFYRELLKNGKPKLEAYKEAQNHLYMKIKNDPRKNQILFLSPWVLMGNPF